MKSATAMNSLRTGLIIPTSSHSDSESSIGLTDTRVLTVLRSFAMSSHSCQQTSAYHTLHSDDDEDDKPIGIIELALR